MKQSTETKDNERNGMKNLIGYEKRHLLDIVDREGTHYNTINGTKVIEEKPPVPRK